jgi:hypothetical protein
MRKVIFHSFTLGDVDDPEIYAAEPIWKWQQTEHGQWVMEHCDDPVFTIHPDGTTWGHRVIISGVMEDKNVVFHELRWKKHANTL